MKFATLSNPFATGPLMGLQVAVRGFFKALYTNVDIESFTFFVQIGEDTEKVRQQIIEKFCMDSSRRDCIKVFNIQALPMLLKQNEIQVMYKGDPYIFDLVNSLRNNGAQEVVSTGLTHSLNSMNDFPKLIQYLLLQPGEREAIICTSPSAQNVLTRAFDLVRESQPLLRGIPNPELPVIPLGHEFMFQELDKLDAKGRCGISVDLQVISYVGRIHRLVKADLMPVLTILSWLKIKHPRVFLLIAGNVSDSERGEVDALKAMVGAYGLNENVGFVENFNEEQKGVIYSASDIFLSPVDNYQETFGLSLLEAMWHGLPIVCSDWGGYKDLVNDEENGFLIPTSRIAFDPQDAFFNPGLSYLALEYSETTTVDLKLMYERLDQLLSSEELRREMGQKGRECSRKYGWDSIVPEYVKLWGNLGQKELNRSTTSFRISQADLFKDYHSNVYDKDKKWSLSTSCRKNVLPPPHFLLSAKINQNLTQEIMKLLESESMSVREISKKLDRDSDLVSYNLGYLSKFGFLLAED